MGVRTWYILSSLSLFLTIALGAPLLDFDDGEAQDTAIVESTVREVRAIKPRDLIIASTNHRKSYGHGQGQGEEGDDIGYIRKKADKGNTGYQKFDSFHKKGGDAYGYEKHDSFGLEEKQGHSAGGTKAAYKKKDNKKKNDGKNAKYQEADYSDDGEDDGEGDESSAEEGDGDAGDYDAEEASETEGDGEGEVNQSGYDEADAVNYENPEGYTYGSGGEYDF